LKIGYFHLNLKKIFRTVTGNTNYLQITNCYDKQIIGGYKAFGTGSEMRKA